MDYGQYFESIGYKYIKQYHKIIVTDFQRHVFPNQPKEWDGIIGPKTLAKINYYNKDNFCPEVFEHIKPYKSYSDIEIEALMRPRLVGLGATFNKCARKNDFDVLHSIAHAILESSYKGLYANSAIARKKNNIYGFGAYDSSPMASAKKFSSFAECIEIWSDWFNRNYLLETGEYYHGDNEYGVNKKYASSPIAGVNKAFIVRQLRKNLNG